MVEISEREQVTDDVISLLRTRGYITDKKPRKERVNWERILVYEYIRARYPNVPSWIRKEVGSVPEGEHSAMYARTRRWVDAIIRPPGKIILIEAKMKPDPKALAQLDMYDSLFSETPEFTNYWNDPRELQLVTAMDDSAVKALAPSYNIKHVVFKPSNFEEWYRTAYKIPNDQQLDPALMNR